MKLLLVAQGLHPYSGGSAVSEASLSAQMSKRCQTIVLCRQGAIDYSFARSFGLKEVREYYPSEVYAAWRDKEHWLNRLMEGVEVCHLNGHWRWEDHFLARICRRKGVPYVLQPRGMLFVGHRSVPLKRVYNVLLGNWVVQHASQVIALSRFEVRQFEPYRLSPQRVSVVPNGITRVDLPSESHVSKEMRELLAQGPYFLYFGRLERRKNLLFLIDVFAEYVRSGGGSRLVIMGPSERGYDEELSRRIAALGLSERIRIVRPSYDSERWVVVERAKGVIYPTIEEPFGRVPFEALSAGALPIVPDESGSAEYLRSLLPQAIYQHQNAASLLQVIKVFDAHTSDEKQALLGPARDWVHSRLDWNYVGDELLNVYERVVGNALRPLRDSGMGNG